MAFDDCPETRRYSLARADVTWLSDTSFPIMAVVTGDDVLLSLGMPRILSQRRRP